MTENDNRYGKNRHAWRKVYGYGRRKPNLVTFYDETLAQDVTKDLNTTLRHRDYFQVKDEAALTLIEEYDEGVVHFNNVTEVTGTFNIVFSSNPVVVYTMEDSGSNNAGNVNIFGVSTPTVNEFRIGASAEFSGSVRYRAVYSNYYPTLIESGLYTASFWIYAGKFNVTDATEYTASFTNMPTGTLEYRAETFDFMNNNSQDVELTNNSLSITTATNSISAPLTNQIHFMVTKPGA